MTNRDVAELLSISMSLQSMDIFQSSSEGARECKGLKESQGCYEKMRVDFDLDLRSSASL